MKQLEDNAGRIELLVAGVTPDQARWRPNAESWSILEVVCHLLDEEREDFRVRLGITLEGPDRPWPPIDPAGWVKARHYNEQELSAVLQSFMEERKSSLAWLASLDSPNLDAAYEAPWGPISAGDLLAAWAAHDLLHMRQLVELFWAYNERELRPYSPAYAGEW